MNIHLMRLLASNVFLLLGALMGFLSWQRAASWKHQRLCCEGWWAALCCGNASVWWSKDNQRTARLL